MVEVTHMVSCFAGSRYILFLIFHFSRLFSSCKFFAAFIKPENSCVHVIRPDIFGFSHFLIKQNNNTHAAFPLLPCALLLRVNWPRAGFDLLQNS